MQLAVLLDEARAASPHDRIEWRDRIASHGQRAITAVEPWLADSALAAFAIRVIWTVGERGAPDEASRVLRAARGRLSPALQGDVVWALAALKQVQKAESAMSLPPASTRHTKVAREREAPRVSQRTRRRSG